jgi:hypothetical protein
MQGGEAAVDAQRVQDAVHRGLGRAGRAVGYWCDVHRPRGGGAPLAGDNLVLRLQAAFSAPGGRFARAQGVGLAYWEGVFDAAYTRPGDYLRRHESRPGLGDGGVWFIAAQQALHPVLCVQANRVIDLLRPRNAEEPGLGAYGGRDGEDEVRLRGWPVAMLPMGGAAGEAGLPERAAGGWTVLLPANAAAAPRVGDAVRDDLGGLAWVAQAALQGAVWRLRLRNIAS